MNSPARFDETLTPYSIVPKNPTNQWEHTVHGTADDKNKMNKKFFRSLSQENTKEIKMFRIIIYALLFAITSAMVTGG